jgi:hypothetical protein
LSFGLLQLRKSSEENEPFPDWKDKECIIVFGDFITWAADNIKLSEVNIACFSIL